MCIVLQSCKIKVSTEFVVVIHARRNSTKQPSIPMATVKLPKMTEEDSDFHLRRLCLFLEDPDKSKRRQALTSILNSINAENSENLASIWEILHKPVVKTLNDPSESCRELALEVLDHVLARLPVSEKYVVYVVPVLNHRLSSQEIVEESEEVRLKCVSLLRLVQAKYGQSLGGHFEDLAAILCRTVTDAYPKVKKESCEAISELAKILPRQFYDKSDVFVKGVLGNFTHQHQRVRVASVKTIGDVLLFGKSKVMEEVATPLAQRLFDQNASVRMGIFRIFQNGVGRECCFSDISLKQYSVDMYTGGKLLTQTSLTR